MPDKKKSSIARTFGDLKVRPKLMVLHNLFFLILAAAAYFALDPLFNRQVYDARARELSLVRRFRLPRFPFVLLSCYYVQFVPGC